MKRFTIMFAAIAGLTLGMEGPAAAHHGHNHHGHHKHHGHHGHHKHHGHHHGHWNHGHHVYRPTYIRYVPYTPPCAAPACTTPTIAFDPYAPSTSSHCEF